MSLEVEIYANLSGVSKEEFVKMTSPAPALIMGCSFIRDKKYNFGVSLMGIHGGLTDDASPVGQGVCLHEEYKEWFKQFLKKMMVTIEGGFELTLGWSGDRINQNFSVSLNEFFSLIDNDQLYNRGRYIVTLKEGM